MTPVPDRGTQQDRCPVLGQHGVSGRRSRRWRRQFARPCGHVISAALCSLARQSLTLSNVDQAADGCTLHAEQPSDFRSSQGEIKVTIVKQVGSTRVEAGALEQGPAHRLRQECRLREAPRFNVFLRDRFVCQYCRADDDSPSTTSSRAQRAARPPGERGRGGARRATCARAI